MPFNFGNLWNAVQSAATSGNVGATVSAISGLQAALGTSQSTIVQAQMYLSELQLAQAKNDQASWTAAVNGLIAMAGALPSGDAPLVQELSGFFGNPSMAADVIARIQASLLKNNVL